MKLKQLHSWLPPVQEKPPAPTPIKDEPVVHDFFHALTKLERMQKGYAQDYGFHELDRDGFRGSFCVGGYQGKVKKTVHGDVARYRCVFADDNVLHLNRRHKDIIEAVQTSAPSYWRYVSLKQLKTDPEPCYAVVAVDKDRDGDIDVVDIYVKHDDHESLAHY